MWDSVFIWSITSDKVCIFAVEVVLLLEVDLAESDEGEDGDVVADADEGHEPEAGRKYQNVPKVNLEIQFNCI